MKKNEIFVLLLIIILFPANFFYSISYFKEKEFKPQQWNVVVIEDNKILEVKDVMGEIKANNIKFPEIVLRQAILESNWFKSNMALTHKNLFGMKYPHRRETTAIGKDINNNAIYANWRDSIKDYKLWQDYVFKKGYIPVNREDYYKFLDNVSYAGTTYSRFLKNFK